MERRAATVLVVGVVSVSTAAILIRLAEAPPLVTAAWRLSLASAIVVPTALVMARAELRALSAQDLKIALLSGSALAVHFALWIASLDHTSVASSVVLVTTTPLWVGLGAPFLLREAVSRSLMTGIAVAFLGGVVIGGGDLARGGGELYGDLLAVGGALAAAAYFMLGRRLRARLSLISYVALVYGAAAVVLVATALIAGEPLTGYPRQTWLSFALLAVVPQIIGHSSLNWALHHLSSTLVAGTVLGEPLGSTLLAWLILDEIPPGATLLGGVLILTGLTLAARGEGPAIAGRGMAPPASHSRAGPREVGRSAAPRSESDGEGMPASDSDD